MTIGFQPQSLQGPPAASESSFVNAFAENALSRRHFLKLLASAALFGATGRAHEASAKSAPLALLDETSLLTILGIIQPAGVESVSNFVRLVLPELTGSISLDYLHATFKSSLVESRILLVRQTPSPHFSNYECIGGANQRKLLCCNDFSLIAGAPDANRVYTEFVWI